MEQKTDRDRKMRKCFTFPEHCKCWPGTDREVTNIVIQRSKNTVPIRLHNRRRRIDLEIRRKSVEILLCFDLDKGHSKSMFCYHWSSEFWHYRRTNLPDILEWDFWLCHTCHERRQTHHVCIFPKLHNITSVESHCKHAWKGVASPYLQINYILNNVA